MRVTRSLALAAQHALIYSTATGPVTGARLAIHPRAQRARERARDQRDRPTDRATIYLAGCSSHSLTRTRSLGSEAARLPSAV
jgi:hypothetical protein